MIDTIFDNGIDPEIIEKGSTATVLKEIVQEDDSRYRTLFDDPATIMEIGTPSESSTNRGTGGSSLSQETKTIK